MPKVTFVHGGFANIGGVETFAADLLSALSECQVHSEFICWASGESRRNREFEELMESGVKISCSNWRWGCRWGWPDRWMVHRFRQAMMNAEVLVFGKLLDRNIHRWLSEAQKRMILITPYRPAEMWKDRRPEKWLLDSFEVIVVQARRFEIDLLDFGYKGQIITLPYLPPETERPNAWPAGPTLQIGFLGRLVPDKNLEYLILSFARLGEMGIEAQLHLFGDGPERDSLSRLTDQMRLAAQVEFHGKLERDEISDAIDRCHVFAFSSRTEGQCLAALEVLARGRPVLGTPVGAFPEFLTGLLGSVAPGDNSAAFATALKSLAKPVLKGEITPADVQQAYKRRFARRQIINQYLQILGSSGAIQTLAQRRTQAV